jgi:hypothetical protein
MNGMIEFLIDRSIAFETSRTFTLLVAMVKIFWEIWTNFQRFTLYNKFIIMNDQTK